MLRLWPKVKVGCPMRSFCFIACVLVLQTSLRAAAGPAQQHSRSAALHQSPYNLSGTESSKPGCLFTEGRRAWQRQPKPRTGADTQGRTDSFMNLKAKVNLALHHLPITMKNMVPAAPRYTDLLQNYIGRAGQAVSCQGFHHTIFPGATVGSSGHSPLKHLSPAAMLQDLLCRPAARAEAVPEALAATQDCAQMLVNLAQLCTAGMIYIGHPPAACHEACTDDWGVVLAQASALPWP